MRYEGGQSRFSACCNYTAARQLNVRDTERESEGENSEGFL